MQATDDLALLIDAAMQAGRIATQFWGTNPEAWDKGEGAGPVTEADLAVDRHLFESLTAARPDYGWLSEETADTDARLSRERLFIVDPIDGTRSFMNGGRDWAHSLAIAHRGAVETAVVYLPLLEKLFVATKGNGATLNGAPLWVSDRQDADGARVVCAPRALDPANWQDGTPPFVHMFRPSLAYRLALVAQGQCDAMVTLRPTWEWDVAAGSLIVHEAGGITCDVTGAPAVFNQPHPRLNGLFGGNATLVADMRARLR